MTKPTQNYTELLELAVLDAHGLLEPIESELFNRSFHDAPASIQDEIIQMQLEFATDDSMLPEDLPPASLRKKVLDAVASAADKEASRLAPLALIGARVGATAAQVGSRETIMFWRTAALVLFGISVVLAVVTMDVQRRATDIKVIAENVVANNSLKILTNVKFVEFINNPYYQVTRLERTQGNSSGYIRVAIHSDTGDGLVFGLDLQAGEVIIIQGTTSSGKVIELARIAAKDSVVAQSFTIDPDLIQGLTIEGFDEKTGVRWL